MDHDPKSCAICLSHAHIRFDNVTGFHFRERATSSNNSKAITGGRTPASAGRYQTGIRVLRRH